MHRLALLSIDLLIVALASFLALELRNNFDVTQVQLEAFIPHLIFTVVVAAVALPLFGTDRAVWRFSIMPDYLGLVVAAVAIVVGAVALGFVYDRLATMSRSLPIMQVVLLVFSLVGVRVVTRLRQAIRPAPMQLATPLASAKTESVLIVGLTRLADLYLQSLTELGPENVKIVGLLSVNERHTGRLVHRRQVLGTPGQITDILRDLDVHGVQVSRIVVAMAFGKLTPEEQRALRDAASRTGLRLELIAESMGLSPASETPGPVSSQQSPADQPMAFSIDRNGLDVLARRPYWRLKRVFDIVVAACLLVILSPVVVLVAVLVAIDVGFPLAFWQQRPGLGGRPFKLYKLRTMARAHDSHGRRRADQERLSGIGKFLRRTRLDELPQLVNILRGEMSFVGPRPLLPIDQPAEFSARLMVRPGLTGWAQVKGGRDVSAADKAALDVWYVHNVSWALDLEVLFSTVPMIVFGETVSETAILGAWRDLRRMGIIRSPLQITEARVSGGAIKSRLVAGSR